MIAEQGGRQQFLSPTGTEAAVSNPSTDCPPQKHLKHYQTNAVWQPLPNRIPSKNNGVFSHK